MNFFDQVYELTRHVPIGKVTTYGDLAHALRTRDARRVGHALHANKDVSTPCHRVVNKNGRLAKSFAFGGSREQYLKLQEEGVAFLDDTHVDLKANHWTFPKS
jgi:methylated-DNA-protein-cysteine methyltransferase related protein